MLKKIALALALSPLFMTAVFAQNDHSNRARAGEKRTYRCDKLCKPSVCAKFLYRAEKCHEVCKDEFQACFDAMAPHWKERVAKTLGL